MANIISLLAFIKVENLTDDQGFLIYDNCRVTCLTHARNILMKELMKLGYQFNSIEESNYLGWYSRYLGGFCEPGKGQTDCIVQIRRASKANKEIGIIKWKNESDAGRAEIENKTHSDVNNSDTDRDRAEFEDNNDSNDADIGVTEGNYVNEPDCSNADVASITDDNFYDNESSNSGIEGH